MVYELKFAVADVVVDGLWHPGRHHLETAFARELGHLVGSVHRVVAADVKEIADVMGAENLDDALEILVLSGLELVAAGPDRAGGRGRAEEGDLR